MLVAVSLQRFALRSTMVVVAIVLMAIDVVALLIFATRNLTLSAIGAAIVAIVAHLATEVFRRFVKEAFFQMLDFLTVK